MIEKISANRRDRRSTANGAMSRPRYVARHATPSGATSTSQIAASGTPSASAERALPRRNPSATPHAMISRPGCSSALVTAPVLVVIAVRALEENRDPLREDDQDGAGDEPV